jgi:hypothetical protein
MMKNRELEEDNLPQLRCPKCGKFFGDGILEKGKIRLWCRNCKDFVTFLGENWDLTESQNGANLT